MFIWMSNFTYIGDSAGLPISISFFAIRVKTNKLKKK